MMKPSVVFSAEVNPVVVLSRIDRPILSGDIPREKKRLQGRMVKATTELPRNSFYARALNLTLRLVKHLDQKESQEVLPAGTLYQELQIMWSVVEFCQEAYAEDTKYVLDLKKRPNAKNLNVLVQNSALLFFIEERARTFSSPSIEYTILKMAFKDFVESLEVTAMAPFYRLLIDLAKQEYEFLMVEERAQKSKTDIFYIEQVRRAYSSIDLIRTEAERLRKETVQSEWLALASLVDQERTKIADAFNSITNRGDGSEALGACVIQFHSGRKRYQKDEYRNVTLNSSSWGNHDQVTSSRSYRVKSNTPTFITDFYFNGDLVQSGQVIFSLPSLSFSVLREQGSEYSRLGQDPSAAILEIQNNLINFFKSDYQSYQRCFE